jgi:acetylornithine deacetylase/succinyl-diaminopimelate desuccinylase-like protein
MSYFKPASVVGGGMLLAVVLGSIAVAQEPTSRRQAFREIYQELVEINTTNSVGDSLRAAEAMAARLKAGGLAPDNVQVLSSAPRKGNLVARLGGNGLRKPILLIAHLDVVEAKREDWDFDPFKLQEINGYFRGRGSIDDKAMASIFVANLIENVKEGFQPDRDIILALTADEELSDSPHDGVHFLLDHHRALIEAEFAIQRRRRRRVTRRQAIPHECAACREGLSDLHARSHRPGWSQCIRTA